jgi:hypothetical protein
MKKILLFILFSISLNLFSQTPDNVPLGKSRTEVFSIFIKDLKYKFDSETGNGALFMDQESDIGHLCIFNSYNRLIEYYILFVPDPDLMKNIIKGLDKRYYRVEKDVLLWTEVYDSKKAKYLMTVSISVETENPLGMLKYYYKN